MELVVEPKGLSMAHTSWLYLAYGAGLFLLLFRREKVGNTFLFCVAWVFYALAVLCIPLFTIMRAVHYRSPSKMALVEIWAYGISWTFVGVSLLTLLGAMLFRDNRPSST